MDRALYLLLLTPLLPAQGVRVEPFPMEVRTVHDTGLPSADVLSVAIDGAGTVWAATKAGLARQNNGKWTREAADASLLATSNDGGVSSPQGALWPPPSAAMPSRAAPLPPGARHIAVVPDIL